MVGTVADPTTAPDQSFFFDLTGRCSGQRRRSCETTRKLKSEPKNVECRRMESLHSLFILNRSFDTKAHDKQNTLFDVRCSLASSPIRLAARGQAALILFNISHLGLYRKFL
jgi:hypothetical protein